MSSGKLTHLIYTSIASSGFDETELPELLRHSRSNNGSANVTGMLLYTDGSFFQVLEGEEPSLLKLFDTISADARHERVVKIIHEPIARRAFADWSMGFAEIDLAEMADLDGINDFFEHGQSFMGLQPGRAKKLLSAFVAGRWRARVHGGHP